MRIIAGRFKGRTLASPSGRTTRPTSDRARETAFNVIAHADWAVPLEGARVMDLYAGSGALGFEALSRGAAFCLFVEAEPRARGVVRSNAEMLDVLGVTRIHRRDATRLGDKPAGVGAPFTLAFIDPPYRKGLLGPTLEMLRDGAWLAPGATVVAEHASDEPAPALDGYEFMDARTVGEGAFAFLRRAL